MFALMSPADRDERAIAVENAGYRWSHGCLSFGLLAVVAYRSFVWNEQPWDLLALVIAGGVVGTLYQARHRVLTRGWLVAAGAAALLAAVLAAIVVALIG